MKKIIINFYIKRNSCLRIKAHQMFYIVFFTLHILKILLFISTGFSGYLLSNYIKHETRRKAPLTKQ